MREEEQGEGNQVHPGQHAVAAVAQEGDQAGEPERRGEEIGADEKLAEQKALGAALAHVAHMDVLEEVVGDEVVAHQPEEVGQEDQERQGDAAPEPAALRVPARAREHDAAENSGDVKDDGVLGQQAQADNGADGQPPARILRLQQANREVRDQHPPQVIEGRVLELGAFEQRQRRERDGESRRELRQRPPPSSCAIRPVTTMAAACARTENRRRPTSERPKSSRPMCSRNGVKGG